MNKPKFLKLLFLTKHKNGLTFNILKQFNVLGPLAAKHRQLISRNSMYNGLNAPNSKVPNSKSLESTFPTW